MLKQVLPNGVVIPSGQSWNELVRAANAVNYPTSGGARGQGPIDAALQGVVRAKGRNNTGGAVRPFAVLGIDTDLFVGKDSFFSQRVLDCNTVSASAHRGKWCVAARDMAADTVGPVFVRGVVPVRLDVQDVDHKCAVLTDGEDYLTSAPQGEARIVAQEEGTGTVWALVELGAGEADALWVTNGYGDTIPGYGALEVTGRAEDGILTVTRPTADSLNQVLVADWFDIPAGATVPIRPGWPKEALVTGTPAAGTEIGTAANSFSLAENKTGFVSYGASGGRVLARPFNAASEVFENAFADNYSIGVGVDNPVQGIVYEGSWHACPAFAKVLIPGERYIAVNDGGQGFRQRIMVRYRYPQGWGYGTTEFNSCRNVMYPLTQNLTCFPIVPNSEGGLISHYRVVLQWGFGLSFYANIHFAKTEEESQVQIADTGRIGTFLIDGGVPGEWDLVYMFAEMYTHPTDDITLVNL